MESHLAPCLANFAAAAGRDSLWKPLNQQLLVKSRHSDSQVHACALSLSPPSLSLSPFLSLPPLISPPSSLQVRFALLKVLEDVYTKLGEEFVVLLPETIPFLAELMEGEWYSSSRVCGCGLGGVLHVHVVDSSLAVWMYNSVRDTHTHTHTTHCSFYFDISDESEEVEQETQSLISVIENIIGESIQQYF